MEKSLIEKELNIKAENFNYTRVLVKAIVFPEKLASGIYMPGGYKEERAKSYNIGKVLKIGSLCFQPEEKFPHGPLCKEGDWIYYSDYQRVDAFINNFQCYFIQDVSVLLPLTNQEIQVAVPFLKELNLDEDDRKDTP